MTNLCLEEEIPKSEYFYETSGFWVIFRKDIYNEEYLNLLGLNERQLKAVLFAKKSGKISNSEYRKLNNVSKRTAAGELPGSKATLNVHLDCAKLAQSQLTGKGYIQSKPPASLQ